jgi:hypothetical protein
MERVLLEHRPTAPSGGTVLYQCTCGAEPGAWSQRAHQTDELLAVLRDPTDEDVERARAAASECWNPGGFLPEPPYTTVEARACIDAFLGGGEV